MNQLWEQQAGETKKAFAAFCIYRDLGDERSTQKVATQLSKSLPLIKRWSSAYEWVNRVDAWDRHLRAQADARDEQRRIQREEYMAAQRQSLIDAELTDYEVQLEKWREVWNLTTPHIKKKEQVLDDGTKVITVALKNSEWVNLTEWRNRISIQGRRALGMPHVITQNQHIGGDDGAPAIRFVWDDDADDNSGHGS